MKVISVFAGTSVDDILTVPKLLEELQIMSSNCPFPIGSQRRVVYLGNSRQRVEAIGEFLNRIGGYDLMLSVAKEIPTDDQRELEQAWHGIGQWQF